MEKFTFICGDEVFKEAGKPAIVQTKGLSFSEQWTVVNNWSADKIFTALVSGRPFSSSLKLHQAEKTVILSYEDAIRKNKIFSIFSVFFKLHC